MKKGILTLAVMTMMVVGTVSVSAAEVEETEVTKPERQVKQTMSVETYAEKLDERIDTLEAKADENLADKEAEHLQRNSDAALKFDEYIARIGEIAPELVDDFTAVYEAHVAVHELLYTERVTSIEAYGDESLAGLIVLQESVIADLEAGLINYKEATEILRDYLATQQSEFKAIKEAYFEEIQPLVEQEEANKVELKALAEQVKAAVEAEDLELAEQLLEEILVYRWLHIDFDYAKLAIMETY